MKQQKTLSQVLPASSTWLRTNFRCYHHWDTLQRPTIINSACKTSPQIKGLNQSNPISTYSILNTPRTPNHIISSTQYTAAPKVNPWRRQGGAAGHAYHSSFSCQKRHASANRAALLSAWQERQEQFRARKQAQHEEHAAKLLKLSLEMSRAIPAVDINVKCTEFASDGSVTRAGQEIDKAKLTSDYDLQARDLRKLDLNSSALPYIFVRPKTIIVNLLQLRLLIQANRVLVVDAEQSADLQSLFAYNLEHRLASKVSPISPHLPFELRALEAVLISVTSGLEAELILVRDPIIAILQELEQTINVDQEILRRLLDRSKKLASFEQKARQVRDALQELLDADDDLAEMYLTDTNAGKPHTIDDHIEAEMLLETYHKVCDGIVESCERLQDDVTKTDEAIKAILDANRNQIMLLDLKMTMSMLGLGAGTMIAGLYGMNTVNFLEDSHTAFFTISSLCVGISSLIILIGRRMLRNIHMHRIRDRRSPP